MSRSDMFGMHRLFSIVLLGFTALPLIAVKPGDSYDSVIAEKGAPGGTIEAGNTRVMNYPTESIKLQGGKVVSVRAVTPTPPRAMSDPTQPPVRAAARGAIPSGAWGVDFRAALAQARQEKRQILLFFTGSDWCGWCRRLDGEVFSTPEFVQFATEKLILVKLDFPKGFRLPDEVAKQNQALASTFRIKGYPTCVLLDPAGNPLGEFGYNPGGPKAFITQLAKM